MRKLFVGLMLVAILGVGAASASAQGFERGRRVVVVETPRYGYYNGWERREEWRRLQRERFEHERWEHRFDRDREFRFRRF